MFLRIHVCILLLLIIICLGLATGSRTETEIREKGHISKFSLINESHDSSGSFIGEARGLCMIGLPHCSSDPSWNSNEWQDDSEFAYIYLGVGKSAANCLERATEWHSFCQNAPTETVQAIFMPTGETATFPSQEPTERRNEPEGILP